MEVLGQLLHRYNPWWSGRFRLSGIIPRERLSRELRGALDTKEIVILTGLRRIGKTTLMRLLIKHLIEDVKVDPRHVFYVSLDDYVLRDIALSELVDAFRAIHKLSVDVDLYLFLDEVTAMRDYEVQLKNLRDLGGVKIYASSSSASVLRSGKAYLTGRHKVVVVPPLDFEEYLRFRRVRISPADRHLRRSYFEDFLKTGGVPEYVLTGDVGYLRQLVDDVICKDIAAYHGIKDVSLLRDFFMLLMERAGKSVSVNKLGRILEISPDTARRYLSFFEETYLVRLVPRHGKLNERLRAPKKLYAADLGIRVMSTGFRDVGSIFENYVYLKIADRDPCFLLVDGIELDFITRDGCLMEVKYYSSLNDRQKELFDKFEAREKLVVASVDDADSLDSESDGVGAGVELAEPSASYVAEEPGVELGRAGRFEVLPV